jgi:hypothetical protein
MRIPVDILSAVISLALMILIMRGHLSFKMKFFLCYTLAVCIGSVLLDVMGIIQYQTVRIWFSAISVGTGLTLFQRYRDS